MCGMLLHVIVVTQALGHTYKAKPECSMLHVTTNMQVNSLKTVCTGWSITQVNISASTGHFIYASLKIVIVGYFLVTFNHNRWTNPGDFIENIGYTSLMFYSNHFCSI